METFARAVRGHWGIENKLHWTMDVCFGEDQSRARTGHAAENLAALRRLALNLVEGEKTKRRSIRGKMLWASWDPPYLTRFAGSPTKRYLDASALASTLRRHIDSEGIAQIDLVFLLLNNDRTQGFA